MKKISILMPTFNDSKTIIKTLDSILDQTYKNWELIICNDGSTDDTEKVLNNYIKKNHEKRIKLINQENKDQLNAIINASNYSNGDYYFILHSDDLLATNDFLEKSILFMNENKNIDGFYCDLIKIDKNGKIFDKQVVNDYKNFEKTIALTLIMQGRNMYVDTAFVKKSVFFDNYMKNYLIWNGPFWLCLDKDKMLNVKKAPFPSIKYRVFEENYANNYLGRLCVFNGEIRVAITLLKNYYIPFYKLQYFLFRLFRKLNILGHYSCFYKKQETKNKYKIIKQIIYSSFNKNEIQNNLFLDSLINFYKKINNNRTITINHEIIKNIDIYYGKDMRIFNKLILNNKISDEYKYILAEMKKGFNTIIIENKNDYNKIKDICKFLCIDNSIKIKIKIKK